MAATREDVKFLSNPKIGLRRKKYCRFRKFGIKYIDYKDADFLLQFINEQGKLLPRRILKSTKLYTPKFRYSQCVKTGPWYTMSGMVALDPATGHVVMTGPGGEARQILHLMQLALPDWGLTLGDLASARIYTTRLDQFSEINKAWEEVFTADIEPPARTCVGVAALPIGATV